MRLLPVAMVVAASTLFAGCASNEPEVIMLQAPQQLPKLTATGYAPLKEQPARSHAQKVLMAMQASKIAAYRELAEQVYGQQVSANTTVDDWLVKDEQIRTSVKGIIRGAKVVKTYPVDDFYVTELELDFEQVWRLYQQSAQQQQLRQVQYF